MMVDSKGTHNKQTQENDGGPDKEKETFMANLFPLPRLILNPGSKLTLNIFEPRYLNLLQSCENDHVLMAIGNASNTFDDLHSFEIPHEQFPFLSSEVGFGEVKVLAQTEAGTKVIVVSGLGKGRVKSVHKEAGGFLTVELEEIPTSNELDEDMTFLYRRLRMITQEKVKDLLKNDRETQVLMENLKTPAELVAFYSDHILSNPDTKIEIFKENDLNSKIQRLGQSLIQ